MTSIASKPRTLSYADYFKQNAADHLLIEKQVRYIDKLQLENATLKRLVEKLMGKGEVKIQ